MRSEAILLTAVLGLAPVPALAWSCASDEPLTAEVSTEERARISAAVARERVRAEAQDCAEEGQTDCPPAPVSPAMSVPADD